MMRSEMPLAGLPTGPALLQNPVLNKGTAFTDAERDAFGLRGLLPPRVCTQDEQVERVLKPAPEEQRSREVHLPIALQDRNETLFYRVVMDDPGHDAAASTRPPSGRRARNTAIFSAARAACILRPRTGAESREIWQLAASPTCG